jgi:hypothetical protein
MSYTAAPATLMQVWRLHRHECRPIGKLVAEARDGLLPGVAPAPSGHGFIVTNRKQALAAMLKKKEAA